MYRNMKGSNEFERATQSLAGVGLKPFSTTLTSGIDFDPDTLSRPEVQHELSRIFKLDQDLFSLRVREVLAIEELARVEREIRAKKNIKAGAESSNVETLCN